MSHCPLITVVPVSSLIMPYKWHHILCCFAAGPIHSIWSWCWVSVAAAVALAVVVFVLQCQEFKWMAVETWTVAWHIKPNMAMCIPDSNSYECIVRKSSLIKKWSRICIQVCVFYHIYFNVTKICIAPPFSEWNSVVIEINDKMNIKLSKRLWMEFCKL